VPQEAISIGRVAGQTGARSVFLRSDEDKAVTWLTLEEARALIHHDLSKAQERLARAISKAWQERTGGLPQPALDPNVPLRIQVIPPPGMRIAGRDWLDHPVLHWESSEIECLCAPWASSRQRLSSTTAIQTRARIEVWGEDLVRIWGRDSSMKYGPAI
jgi:hypothetical protein